MNKYELWDKKSSINNVETSYFLNKEPFKSSKSDIILIYGENNKVNEIQCKNVLASIYEIDESLPLDEFMAAYFSKLEETEEELPEE